MTAFHPNALVRAGARATGLDPLLVLLAGVLLTCWQLCQALPR